jgi:hypothetical protein
LNVYGNCLEKDCGAGENWLTLVVCVKPLGQTSVPPKKKKKKYKKRKKKTVPS